MRTDPPAETTLLRDERKQLDEERLTDELETDSLEDYEDEDDEDVYEDEAVREAWGFSADSRRGVSAGRPLSRDAG